MGSTDIVKEALALKPQERYMVVQELLKSLDESDENIDIVWNNEAQSRLEAYKSGKLQTISMNAIFGDE